MWLIRWPFSKFWALTLVYWRGWLPGGGLLTYLAERGCAALMGRFLQEILKHGSTFLTEPKFLGFGNGENPENHKIFEKWAYFSRKILKNGYPSLPKSPLKIGRGLRLQWHTPVQLKSEYPSPWLVTTPWGFSQPTALKHLFLPLNQNGYS